MLPMTTKKESRKFHYKYYPEKICCVTNTTAYLFRMVGGEARPLAGFCNGPVRVTRCSILYRFHYSH